MRLKIRYDMGRGCCQITFRAADAQDVEWLRELFEERGWRLGTLHHVQDSGGLYEAAVNVPSATLRAGLAGVEGLTLAG